MIHTIPNFEMRSKNKLSKKAREALNKILLLRSQMTSDNHNIKSNAQSLINKLMNKYHITQEIIDWNTEMTVQLKFKDPSEWIIHTVIASQIGLKCNNRYGMNSVSVTGPSPVIKVYREALNKYFDIAIEYMVAVLAYTVNYKLSNISCPEEPEWNPYLNSLPNFSLKCLTERKDDPQTTFSDIISEMINSAQHDETGDTHPPVYEKARIEIPEEDRKVIEDEIIPEIILRYTNPSDKSKLMFKKLVQMDQNGKGLLDTLGLYYY